MSKKENIGRIGETPLNTKYKEGRGLVADFVRSQPIYLRITHLYIQKQRHYFANKGSFSPLDCKRVPWTARRPNQSILKEISPGCSLEGMMLNLKLQYFGHLMQRVDSLKKIDAGRGWG